MKFETAKKLKIDWDFSEAALEQVRDMYPQRQIVSVLIGLDGLSPDELDEARAEVRRFVKRILPNPKEITIQQVTDWQWDNWGVIWEGGRFFFCAGA